MRKILARVFLVLGFALLALSFLEITIRTEWVTQKLNLKQQMKLFPGETKFFREDSRCGYLLNSLPTTQNLTINSLGFRGGSEVQREKPNEVVRILCMGSSFTFGYRVKDDETYPYFLQKILEKRFPEKKFQIINAGIPAFSSLNNSLFFINYLSDLQADIIIYQQSRYNSPLLFIRDDSERRIFVKLYRFLRPIDSWIQKRSLLYSTVKANILKVKKNEENIWDTMNQQLELLEAKGHEPEERELFYRNLNGNVKYIKKLSFLLALVETPSKAFSIKKEDQSGDVLRMVSKENDIPLISTEGILRKKNDLFYDPIHLNSKGNKIFAEIVASKIQELFLLF